MDTISNRSQVCNENTRLDRSSLLMDFRHVLHILHLRITVLESSSDDGVQHVANVTSGGLDLKKSICLACVCHNR